MNMLKQALAADKVILSVNCGGVALPMIDAMSRHGANCLFIDCERTAISVDSVPMLARAAKAAGLGCVVRSESADASILLRYLDCGIDGLVVPQVEDPAICDRMARVARQFGKGDASGTVLIAQIESVEGQKHLAQIAGHPAVDLILIGPNDLSHSMGFDGDTSRAELKQAVIEISQQVRQLRKPFGLPVTQQNAESWISQGARFLYTNLEQFIAPSLSAMAQVSQSENRISS